ncbi:armadillo-type protein, partial [Polychytrium aggregatum]|uniref:armadillo-type protein n=1 Tax=Polychytrium aggregatum TaxID=110093 RepID=UPI0022FE9EE9
MSSRPITQSELLQWAVLNTATQGEDTTTETRPELLQRGPIDPKWIEVILGKEDSARMKECVETCADPNRTLDEKYVAMDELEMLVESLDNANDLRVLKLWKPIISILESDPNAELRAMAAWVLGTAVQNNSQAQNDMAAEGGLPVVVKVLQVDPSHQVRAKTMYCLSSLLKHNEAVLDAFIELHGFKAFFRLLDAANMEDVNMYKRLVWCIHTLLMEAGQEGHSAKTKAQEEVQKTGIVEATINLLGSKECTEDLANNIICVVSTFIRNDMVTQQQQGKLRQHLARWAQIDESKECADLLAVL